MGIRGSVAVTVGKGTQWALRTFTKGGTSLPGKLAAKIDPSVLAHLANGYEVVIITGTNGKTLTTSLAFHVLRGEQEQTGQSLLQASQADSYRLL